jgi:hypothetical protein
MIAHLSVFCLKRFNPIKFCKKGSKGDPRSLFEPFLQNKSSLKVFFPIFKWINLVKRHMSLLESVFTLLFAQAPIKQQKPFCCLRNQRHEADNKTLQKVDYQCIGNRLF